MATTDPVCTGMYDMKGVRWNTITSGHSSNSGKKREQAAATSQAVPTIPSSASCPLHHATQEAAMIEIPAMGKHEVERGITALDRVLVVGSEIYLISSSTLRTMPFRCRTASSLMVGAMRSITISTKWYAKWMQAKPRHARSTHIAVRCQMGLHYEKNGRPEAGLIKAFWKSMIARKRQSPPTGIPIGGLL